MKDLDCSYWIRHFELNQEHRPEPAWHAPMALPEAKRAALAATLAQYQLGDGGGPCSLIAGDAERLRASQEQVRRVIDLWFREEAGHSRLLGEAVTRLRGEFVTESLPFSLFLFVRRLFSAQSEMLVLLVVEIVSTGYYRLVRRHCGDKPIADMCGLILRDEAGHVAFHEARLASCYRRGLNPLQSLWLTVLAYACTSFLWLSHGRWLSGIGSTSGELFCHVQHGLRRFVRQVNARSAAARVGHAPNLTTASAV